MRYRVISRLAIHIIGIYLLASAIPDLIQSIAFALYDRFITATSPNSFMIRWGHPSITLVQVLIGAWLAFRAHLLVRWIIPPSHAYCPACGADWGRESLRRPCPDCGSDIHVPSRNEETRR